MKMDQQTNIRQAGFGFFAVLITKSTPSEFSSEKVQRFGGAIFSSEE
jgi:hypothetical protein